MSNKQHRRPTALWGQNRARLPDDMRAFLNALAGCTCARTGSLHHGAAGRLSIVHDDDCPAITSGMRGVVIDGSNLIVFKGEPDSPEREL